MIDERALIDPSRCPACGAALPSTEACPSCGVSLRSATAADVWRVSVQAAALLDQRGALVERLRTESRPATAQSGYAPAPSSAPPRPARAPVRTPESSKRRVQNLLLGLGVLLLAVAAVIFLVVSWDVLGVGGRAAVMAGCTAIAATGAAFASRRGLGATAEAVALLTVGLALLDARGARSAGLADLDSAPGLPYWAGALGLIALAAGAGAVAMPRRSLRVSAAVLGQLPGPLLAAEWADGADHPAVVVATVLTVQAIATVALVIGWPFAGSARDARVVAVAGSTIAWSGATLAAAVAAYGEDGSLVLGTLLLLVLAGAAVGAAVTTDDEATGDGDFGLSDPMLGAAALVTVAAVWAPAAELATSSWVPPTLSALAVALLAATWLAPERRRLSPILVFLLAAAAPGLAAAEAVAVAVLGRLSWLGEAWTELASATAREVVGVNLDWPGEASTPLLLLSVAVAIVVAVAAEPRVHDRGGVGGGGVLRPALVAVVPVLALALLTTPGALDLPFRVALGVDITGALLLLGAGPALVRAGRAALGWAGLWSGTVLLGVAVAWSFAAAATTLAVLPVAAAVLVAAGWQARRLPGSAPVPLAFGTGAVLLLIGEAAALARYGEASWPAVWSLALSLGVGAALAAAVVLDGNRRRVLAAIATAVFAADTAAVTVWAGGSVADAGLVVAVTGALVVLASCQTLVRWAVDESLTTLQGRVGAVTTTVGVLITALDADRLWLALLAAGVAAGVAAIGASVEGHQRNSLGWLSGGLLAASTWVRLALSDVTSPEPYTVPAAIALLVVGARRRRRDPSYRSWTAYAPGLALAMVPSLLRAVTDAGELRPLLLGLVALAVLAVGVARRLQAPLVIGGLVLAVDALVQLSPYLADLYAAVPRWLVIGAVGLLLLGLGATYERRVRDVRLLTERLAALG